MRTKLLALCIALASTCAMVHRGSAQDLRLEAGAVDVQVFPPKPVPFRFQISGKKRVQAATEQQRAGFQRYLAVRIDQLKRVCHLSDEQVKTLQVAAKGAVRQSMGRWQKQVKRRQAQFHLAPGLRGRQNFLDLGDVLPILADDRAAAEEAVPAFAAEGQEEVDGQDQADPGPPPPRQLQR